MADVRDLYQEVILDHYRNPRNFRRLEHANRHADGFNPLCGDKFIVFVQIENGMLKDIGIFGAGCAIATASASMMTESLKGKTEPEARELIERFHQLLGHSCDSPPDASILGELMVFSGVREYPVRVKCATLAWHALSAALEGANETAATEYP
jgi:nitrogen fixation protein NifU and related proteins